MSINGMMFDYTTIIVLVKVLSDWQRDNRFIHGRFPYNPILWTFIFRRMLEMWTPNFGKCVLCLRFN